jgi:hypothetical protein
VAGDENPKLDRHSLSRYLLIEACKFFWQIFSFEQYFPVSCEDSEVCLMLENMKYPSGKSQIHRLPVARQVIGTHRVIQ